jgi:hypothetical protein
MAWSGNFDKSAWGGSSMPMMKNKPTPYESMETTSSTMTRNPKTSAGRRQPIATLSAGLPNVVIKSLFFGQQ